MSCSFLWLIVKGGDADCAIGTCTSKGNRLYSVFRTTGSTEHPSLNRATRITKPSRSSDSCSISHPPRSARVIFLFTVTPFRSLYYLSNHFTGKFFPLPSVLYFLPIYCTPGAASTLGTDRTICTLEHWCVNLTPVKYSM